MNSRTKKFLSYYKPYLGLFWADMACAFVVSAITLILPLCVRYITIYVLEASQPGALKKIYMMGAVMLALIAVHTVCDIFISYKGHRMGAMMESDMRSELFDHYQKLSFSFYDEHKTGQLMSRATNDILSLAELYHHGPEDIVISALKLIGALAILFTIDVKLTLIVFLFLPVMAVYACYLNKRMNAALRRTKERIGDINAQVEDTLAGIRVVKSFANEQVERQKFACANERFVQSRSEGYKSEAYFFEGMNAFTHLITTAVVVFGGAAIVGASLEMADLLTYILCVGILIEPIKRLVNFARLYQEGITGFDRFMDMLEIEPDIHDAKDAEELTDVRGHIAFRDVSFKYKEDYGHVLKHVTLDIQSGEYVAVVGPSGAGKSTLCSLIPRFYEVSEGTILLDGRDIRKIGLRSLRKHIGVVQQDVYLFAGSVLDNIRYGNMEATREEILEAAKQANAHEFIMELPHGYDTDIGQRGVKLSGGQKQRLSIARVFLKNPPILILDEATSALDNESERAVQDSLERLTRHRTTLVIAHRLSTVRNAQRIVVLTDSGIEEQGTHEQLLARSGVYANLHHMQLRM
ncbi:Putative multidrug export ATP-binding/permease protein [Paenibacillus konkukensis]|uniref:Multidrug export ATP-binding/permease protein n=1 Tax=Paenibacillus konkukensis TaxID=2020716 RepID=A0ABY4RI82_9BACL|nr:ABC transporter ATP-binding protein [Paenibacillus konkukensis]UQZ81223.1 Putative multidrug export ATP-binding/permease protein [Paenibacillus konkukensis]